MNECYIAGFFDGEGSLTINKNRFRISIPQTNYEVLEKIKLFFNFGQIYKTKKQKEHHKDAWVYTITNNSDVLKFIKCIAIYLVVKKELIYSSIILLEKMVKEKDKINKQKDIDKIKIIELVNSGLSYRKIEKIIGFSRQKICRLLKETT